MTDRTEIIFQFKVASVSFPLMTRRPASQDAFRHRRLNTVLNSSALIPVLRHLTRQSIPTIQLLLITGASRALSSPASESNIPHNGITPLRTERQPFFCDEPISFTAHTIFHELVLIKAKVYDSPVFLSLQLGQALFPVPLALIETPAFLVIILATTSKKAGQTEQRQDYSVLHFSIPFRMVSDCTAHFSKSKRSVSVAKTHIYGTNSQNLPNENSTSASKCEHNTRWRKKGEDRNLPGPT